MKIPCYTTHHNINSIWQFVVFRQKILIDITAEILYRHNNTVLLEEKSSVHTASNRTWQKNVLCANLTEKTYNETGGIWRYNQGPMYLYGWPITVLYRIEVSQPQCRTTYLLAFLNLKLCSHLTFRHVRGFPVQSFFFFLLWNHSFMQKWLQESKHLKWRDTLERISLDWRQHQCWSFNNSIKRTFWWNEARDECSLKWALGS